MRSDDIAVVVIPCFNEAHRLIPEQFLELLVDPLLEVVLVDDGSTDGSAQICRNISHLYPRVSLLESESNEGKARAIAHGIRHAVDLGARYIGYTDIDMPIPPREILRLLNQIRNSQHVEYVSGARVCLAGGLVARTASRKWVGRVIATLISLKTGVPLYDPQSPCKWMRNSEELRIATTRNFKTRWFGDAELLLALKEALLRSGKELTIREFALEEWAEVPGGHLSLRSTPLVVRDFLRLLMVPSPHQS